MDQDEEFENFTESIGEPELTQELFWEGAEYDFSEKTAEWFWLFGTIAVLIIIISIILKDYLLALIIGLGSFVLGTYARRPPQTINYGLTKTGIKYGERLIPYTSIRSFWVEPERKILFVDAGRLIKPHIVIPLADNNPAQIRQLLQPILIETKYEDSISDIVTEFFGF